MKIKVAENAGFCSGVRRAVNLLERATMEHNSVYMLGDIIHNPFVMREFEEKGVKKVDEVGEIPDGATVFIRAHGVSPEIYAELEKRNLKYIDATCPDVKRIHRFVLSNNSLERTLLIMGDSSHPEVLGICGYSTNPAFCFNSFEELQKAFTDGLFPVNHPITVIAQTTFNIKEWINCSNFIKKAYTNAVISDTICSATQKRQKKALELSENVDAFIIIGGKKSSNTIKLYELCRNNCPTFLIEDPQEIKNLLSCLKDVQNIGITAGASTPDRLIKEAIKIMTDNINLTEEQKTEKSLEPISSAILDAAPENDIVSGVADSNEITDDMSFEEGLEKTFKTLNTGERVTATIVAVNQTELQVDLGTKHAGYISVDELTNGSNAANPTAAFKVGDKINAVVVRVNDVEGVVTLSQRRYDAISGWDNMENAEGGDQVFEGIVTEAVNGGVIVLSSGLRVFIPGSHIAQSKDADLSSFLRKKVKFKILEVNRGRRKIVGSVRAYLREEKRIKTEAFWNTAEVGARYTGIVRSLTSYGAFVEIDGVDGMVHISELSWQRLKHPSEVVSVGDTIDVYIKKLDKEKKQIALGYRKQEDNPWEIFIKKHQVGDIVNATIVKFMTFGAFAQVMPNVDGLIHISQISLTRIQKPQDVLELNQQVTVKITDIDLEKKRISLSIRELLESAAGIDESDGDKSAPEVSAESAETNQSE